MGDCAKALECYQKALRIHEKTLGIGNLRVATNYYNIGTVYCIQGKYKKALQWMDKALAVRLKILGAEHPDTKSTLKWIDRTKRRLSNEE